LRHDGYPGFNPDPSKGGQWPTGGGPTSLCKIWWFDFGRNGNWPVEFHGSMVMDFSYHHYSVVQNWEGGPQPYWISFNYYPYNVSTSNIPQDPGYGPDIPEKVVINIPERIDYNVFGINKIIIDSVWASNLSEIYHGPERAIDGIVASTVPFNFDGRWSTNYNSIPTSFYAKLKDSTDVKYFKTSFNYWDIGRIWTYSIDVSQDGITWYNIVPLNDTIPYLEWEKDVIIYTQKIKYIRLNIVGNSQGTYAGLWEFEIYGN